jgi:hypothetical protein
VWWEWPLHQHLRYWTTTLAFYPGISHQAVFVLFFIALVSSYKTCDNEWNIIWLVHQRWCIVKFQRPPYHVHIFCSRRK